MGNIQEYKGQNQSSSLFNSSTNIYENIPQKQNNYNNKQNIINSVHQNYMNQYIDNSAFLPNDLDRTFPNRINLTLINVNDVISQNNINNKYTQYQEIIKTPNVNLIPFEENNGKKINVDLEIINNNDIIVKVPVNNNKIWKKKYNKNQQIGTVINDYLKENNLSLPENYFNDLSMLEKRINSQDKISTLLPNNEKEIQNNIDNKSIDLKPEDEIFVQKIAKPFYNPFEILCFSKNEKKFKILRYTNELKDNTEINKFGTSSAYCNGFNHLYLSGGENSLNKFWDIDLKKDKIKAPKYMPPKKNHSMIYIAKYIIFLVGGNNLETFYYNIKEKKIINWGRLNILRIEPALHVIKNKLYCIDSYNNINNNHNYTLEVTELTSNEGKWELIQPKLSFNIINRIFNQQYFGVSKDKDDNILFLGGSIHNNEKNMNFMYNIKDNIIELSHIKYEKFNLKEKTFCPFNKKYDYILTDFPRNSPQIAFYNKNKGKIELINFSSINDSKIFEVDINDNSFFNNNNNKRISQIENHNNIEINNNKKSEFDNFKNNEIDNNKAIDSLKKELPYNLSFWDYKNKNNNKRKNNNLDGIKNSEVSKENNFENINGVSPNLSFWEKNKNNNYNEMKIENKYDNNDCDLDNNSFMENNINNKKNNFSRIEQVNYNNVVSPFISFWDNELENNINNKNNYNNNYYNNINNQKNYNNNMKNYNNKSFDNFDKNNRINNNFIGLGNSNKMNINKTSPISGFNFNNNNISINNKKRKNIKYDNTSDYYLKLNNL